MDGETEEAPETEADVDAGKDALAIAKRGGPLRVRCSFGCAGSPQSRVPQSVRLRSRSVGPERTLARVCREAGASVRCNVRLRDVNVAVPAAELCPFEVLASWLPLHHVAPDGCGLTVGCALTSASQACVNAATEKRQCWSRHALTRNESTPNLSKGTAAVWWWLAWRLEAVGAKQ